MDYKISDSEWKVMEILWEKGTATQSEVMDALTEGWNKNTVYTFLSRLEHKGLVVAEGSPKRYAGSHRARGMCETGGGKLSEQGLSWLGRKTGGGVRGGGQADGEGEGNAEAASGGMDV